MTHLDLFSGIGGFKLAAQWAGYDTVGFSEICPYASKILNQHWPHIHNYGDIRTADFTNIGDVDLLTGGFPCQPFSVAGKRKGKDDNRHLWPEMLRVISQVKPARILGENVTGIIGMELDNVLADLEAIGYTTWPLVIPACAVDARHQRKRVWILALSTNSRIEGMCEWEDTTLEDVPHPNGKGLEGQWEVTSRIRTKQRDIGNRCRWEPEPAICRVVNGLPNRSHRLKGLGNSIVPQVAYQILKNIPKYVMKCGIRRDSKDDDCGHLNKVSSLPSKDTKKEGERED